MVHSASGAIHWDSLLLRWCPVWCYGSASFTPSRGLFAEIWRRVATLHRLGNNRLKGRRRLVEACICILLGCLSHWLRKWCEKCRGYLVSNLGRHYSLIIWNTVFTVLWFVYFLASGAHKDLGHGAMNGPFQISRSILIWKRPTYAEIDEIFLFKSWNSSWMLAWVPVSMTQESLLFLVGSDPITGFLLRQKRLRRWDWQKVPVEHWQPLKMDAGLASTHIVEIWSAWKEQSLAFDDIWYTVV